MGARFWGKVLLGNDDSYLDIKRLKKKLFPKTLLRKSAISFLKKKMGYTWRCLSMFMSGNLSQNNDAKNQLEVAYLWIVPADLKEE